MRINSLVKMLFAMPLLLAATLFTACDKGGDEVTTPPTVGVTKGQAGETTISFTVTAMDAEKLAYSVFVSSEIAPDAATILSNGVALPLTQTEPVVVNNLTPETEYCIIAAASNKGGAVKSAPVTMTTLKAQAPVIEIKFEIVAGESAEFEAEGGNGTIEYEIEDPAFDAALLNVSCEAEWVKDIKVLADESKATYTVEANTKSESRSTKIVLTYANITREVAISQKPHVEENKPALSLKSEATMKFAAEGGNGAIKYELINPAEGVELKVACEASWVSAVAVDATKSEISFTVAANQTYEARATKVKATYGELSFEVAVEQAAAEKPADPELTLKSEATNEFAAEGGNGEFAFELKNAVEGTELKVSCEAAWVSGVAVDAANSKVTYVVAANDSTEARETKVVLTYGELKVEVAVKQAGVIIEGDYVLTITSESVKSFEAEGGSGVINFTIENPSDNITLDVTVKNNEDWITIGAISDNSVSYSIAENTSEEERSTYIILTYGTINESVRIIQRGVEPEVVAQEVEFTTAKLFKKEGGGIFTIEFSNADNQTLYVPFNSSVNDYLAAGTYSAGMDDNEFVYPTTYMIVGGTEYQYNDEGLNAKDVNTIVVELAADNTYTFTFNNLTFGKEYIASGSWSGKIEGLGIFEEEEEFEPTHIANECMWGGYSSISWGNYYNVQGENFSLQLHFCTDVALENSIAAGEYQWVTNGAITNSNPERFSTRTFTVNGNSVAVDSGKATVKVSGEEYTINLTLDGRDGNTYCIQYVGKLNVKYVAPDDGGDDEGGEGGEDDGNDDGNDDGDPNTITLNTFVYNSDLRSNYLGYLFKATAENVELGICIGSKSCSKTSIDAGDYTYNQYPEDLPFAFQLRGSKINGTDVSQDPNATMNVAVNGGVYTITIVTNGYTLTYNGTL